MSCSQYVQGSLARMTLQINAQSLPPTCPPTLGALTDAGTVTAKITDPAGVVTTLTVVRDSVGQYHADFTTVLTGLHVYEFLASGGSITAINAVGQFLVTEATF